MRLEVRALPPEQGPCPLRVESSLPSGNAVSTGSSESVADDLYGSPPRVPSSRGLGHHPLKVATRVRIPLGLPVGSRRTETWGARRPYLASPWLPWRWLTPRSLAADCITRDLARASRVRVTARSDWSAVRPLAMANRRATFPAGTWRCSQAMPTYLIVDPLPLATSGFQFPPP